MVKPTDLSGRWVKLRGKKYDIYVVELAWGAGYYTWCDHPRGRTVESYQDAVAAIEAGLRRAAQLDKMDEDEAEQQSGSSLD